MSYGQFESVQSVEVVGSDGGYHQLEIQLTLDCCTPSDPGQCSGPAETCYEAEGAEFELDSIHLLDDKGNPTEISESLWYVIVGDEIAERMREDAQLEANESGEF